MIKCTTAESTLAHRMMLELSGKKLETFNDMILTIESDPTLPTKIMKQRRLELIFDIISINTDDNDYWGLLSEYNTSRSAYRKIEIRKGSSRSDAYKSKLQSRPQPTDFSVLTTGYWINRKGMTLSEATIAVSDMQRKYLEKQKLTGKFRLKYKNFSEKIRHSKDYWTSRGYSSEESEVLRTEYLTPMKNDLSSLQNKYGDELGLEKYKNRVDKYTKTMRDELPNRRTGGYVSIESKKFFVKLYKFCRSLGIDRTDICVGITGSREYFIRDNSKEINSGFFYDFTIKSLKFIVEYHGVFWHARHIEEWKNPWCNYQTSLVFDSYKIKLAESVGMRYNIVWSDSDKNLMLNELKTKIQELYDR
jgi:hypothetical protein